VVSMECFEVSNIQGLHSDWISFENHSTDSFITVTRQHFSPQYIYIIIILYYNITYYILYKIYNTYVYVPIVPIHALESLSNGQYNIWRKTYSLCLYH